MLADLVDHVIGVDPDRDRVTAAVVCANTGAEIDRGEFATTTGGYADALAWADERTSAETRMWSIEGTGSYGAGLAVTLGAGGEWVIEFDRPAAPAARDGAKSDGLDALRAAREALGRTKWATPRARGTREALPTMTVARNSAQQQRTATINELKAIVLTAPVAMRDTLAGLSTTELVDRCARVRPDPDGDTETFGTKNALRALAQRIQLLTRQAADLETRMGPLVNTAAPQLLDETGIGVVTAAQILISWSHPGRCRNEAAFARLAGAAPVEATSGQNQTRHRLNRGGDRQLNRALHPIIIERAHHDPRTRAYIDRRTTNKKTPRETRRCLKRYLARHLYRILENPPTPLDKR
jgi:transposase